MNKRAIVWFRKDLRCQDNPALRYAVESGYQVLPLFIYSDKEGGDWATGEASRWWLHQALLSLQEELGKLGGQLRLMQGESEPVLRDLLAQGDWDAVFWNRCYEPWRIAIDTRLKSDCEQAGVEVKSFNGSLLFEPHRIANKSGKPFRVFTPFWKHLQTLAVGPPEASVGAEASFVSESGGLSIDGLALLPQKNWDEGLAGFWGLSDVSVSQRLQHFVEETLAAYGEGRDVPAMHGTSRLSPFLHWGQVSPRQVWHAVKQGVAEVSSGAQVYLSEIAWREFAYHLLYHFPHTTDQALYEKYRDFPWQPNAGYLQAWQRGQTGYPIVDAGMRQLWQTGWMHNRVRMIVASFLVKHLLQPWQEGARWFWDTLVDADLASNSMGWQWSAGCGADAAPYFRVFNPMTQGAKFDSEGEYVRRYVPELGRLPKKYIHAPWEASVEVRQACGVFLGENYPLPIVDHKEGRERALAAWQSLKKP